ncbi:hypothetical protein COCNU_scaffold026528G000010 [Cocos nucifera]|nr:hypothetical protein [Cocos nucifera]
MSDMKAAEASEQLSTDNNVKEKVDGDASDEGPVILDQTEENAMPSSQEEEEAIKKKYGGMLLKKPPLISKDHERAYFDSADWALGKQGGQPHKPKGPLEALRPKLQSEQRQANVVLELLRCFPCLKTFDVRGHSFAGSAYGQKLGCWEQEGSLDCLEHHLKSGKLKGSSGQKPIKDLTSFILQEHMDLR